MLNKTAGTQYNDWIGGAAFDDADIQKLSDYAKSAGHIQLNEYIFSFEATYSSIARNFTVNISYTHLSYDEFKASDTALSNTSLELTPEEFFALFKRANFAVARKGL